MSVIKKHQSNIAWEECCENVFADLVMPGAEEKLAKVKLAFKINEIIRKKRLKQSQAAELLGLDQPKISLIHRGHLKDFSIERLAYFVKNQRVHIDPPLRVNAPLQRNGSHLTRVDNQTQHTALRQ